MGPHTKTRNKLKPDDSVAILDSIRRIVRALRVGSRLAEKSVGLSGAQLFVLQSLRDKPAASINDLAALTRTHQSSVSVVVQRLVDRKLIVRSPSATDARRLELSLTPAAKRLMGNAPDAAQNRLIAAIDSLPSAKRTSLSKLLAQVVRAMGEETTDIEMFFEENHAR